MFYIIYKTTNIINGKFYIGKHQTKDLLDGYLGSGKLLKRAINKYGIDNFHREILHICKDKQHMNLLESILVVPDPEVNYNLCAGGKGGFSYINSVVYTKEKRVEHNRNISSSGSRAQREKHSDMLSFWAALCGSKSKGKELSSDVKKKISESCASLMWITNGVISRKVMKTLSVPDGWRKGRTVNAPSKDTSTLLML